MRRVGQVLGAAVVLVGALAVPTASAQPSTPNQHAACVLTTGTPYKSGDYVAANFGTVGCPVDGPTGYGYRLEFWRERWYGWQSIGSHELPGGAPVEAWYAYCKGEGTYTYKAVLLEAKYDSHVKSSPTKRFTC
ncbi:hypothetical protein [Streptomyces aureoverticillatus]|uniref:hypothetical protein n=1 Tax=Streptomyces aureoverticillatus TaxID=66871 RepID=UPI0013DB0254|nr:hypothetical protein [Streptomyces aureoverticillatus]QIB49525.1 hypothetical protein G3H79_40875 [Streptomyces aureoverticillatus]